MTSRRHYGSDKCKAPFMDDGRHFTDYRPSCYADNLSRLENGITCSQDHRYFLTHNALAIMRANSQASWEKNGCGPCKNLCLGIDDVRPGNSTPFDTSKCIPPKDYVRYYGEKPMNSPVLNRPVVPSGAMLNSHKYSTP